MIIFNINNRYFCFMSFLDDFISLVYPRLCLACENSLYKYEACICSDCRYHLPKTNFHLESDNPVSQLFWGKAPIHSATAYYHFSKGGKVQHLIHQLKYKGKKEVGITIGNFIGKDLAEAPLFETVDYIVPVPLHKKRLKTRGYNQSEMIGLGIAENMKAELDTEVLYRTFASETQTKKSRYRRWENVKEIFAVRNTEKFENKHILLIDDVITTGATIEACVNMLIDIKGIKVSIACLAYA
jgi:ComF family protein